MSKKVILLLIVSIFLISFVNAQSTQFNKLFLSPFYRTSMTNNQNYSYTLDIAQPENQLLNVQSALLSFDVYISPTVTFNLWVNNQACNNPTYTISTTYASAGQSRITFDCSNVIKKAGTYNVIIKPTLQNTGAITGWSDISYSLTPSGTMEVHGTEYVYGDNGKVWLQLVDGTGNSVENGVCFADIYYPDGSEYLELAKMTNMNHDGVYYYDFIVPSTSGVFPSIARCYYIASQTYFFGNDYFVFNGTYNSGTVSNTYSADSVVLRFREQNYGGGRRRVIAGLNFTSSNICTNISEDLLTGITIRTVTKFDSDVGDDITLSIYNYTSGGWVNLFNKVLEGNAFRDVSNSFNFNNISGTGFVNSSGSNIRIKYTDTNISDGADSNLDIDYLSVSCDQLASPEWQEVRGSSEVHVSPPINYTAIAEYVWINPDRNLTYYQDVTNYTLINYGVWTYKDRNLTYYQDIVNYSKIVEDVWSYENRSLTYYQVNNLSALDVADVVWTYASRNLTQNIALEVWNYQDRNLTYEYINNLSAEDIWNYINRSLTDNIAEQVWSYSNKTLTYYEVNNISVEDIWTYVNRSLTQDVASEVWIYNNRSLTYYPDMTNYSLINFGVWSYTNRSLTEFYTINESSLISSIASAIWGWTGSVSSTITNTFSSVFWSNANYSEVARYVWEYNNRSLTFYQVNNISAGEIFNYLNGSLTIVDNYNYSKMAETNWNYVDRNLTVYPIGNNITIADIWSYYNRSLSDNGVLQIWGMNNISADVWSYQNRTLTYYTINFTDLIGMISNYTYSDIGFTLLPSQQYYQFTGNLNVILVSPQYAGK